jgi:hypothetical protein
VVVKTPAIPLRAKAPLILRLIADPSSPSIKNHGGLPGKDLHRSNKEIPSQHPLQLQSAKKLTMRSRRITTLVYTPGKSSSLSNVVSRKDEEMSFTLVGRMSRSMVLAEKSRVC